MALLCCRSRDVSTGACVADVFSKMTFFRQHKQNTSEQKRVYSILLFMASTYQTHQKEPFDAFFNRLCD